MKISSLTTAPEQTVSHNGAITKKTLVSNGEITAITNFSRAVFPVGEKAPAHIHADMTEVFHLLRGRGSMTVDGRVIEFNEGMCITIEPGESHELANTGNDDMEVIYFGVASAVSS